MSLLEAIILAIIQGVTEFLPVSSSGHLAIFKNLFGLKDMGLTYDILLHLGTLLAVFVVYWKDILRLIIDGVGIIADCIYNFFLFFKNTCLDEKNTYRKIISNSYRKFALLIIVSTIPTGIIGVIGGDIIENAGATLIVPGLCLLITGVLLLIADNIPEGDKTPKKTTYGNALFTGIAQGVATLPGISRSGTTITACLACGMKKEFAVKYSFIMSIPAIMGAVVLDLTDLATEQISTPELTNYIVGTIVAAVVGYICIKTMLVVVKNKKFKYFSYYCFVMGAVAIITYFVK
ncbi:MAG: undecaprenyl-diphosphate phosphatase [Eubacterium sp.]